MGGVRKPSKRRPWGGSCSSLLFSLMLAGGLFLGCVREYPEDPGVLAAIFGNGSPPELGSVQALYPLSGNNWNDYVLADGTNFFNASDTACAGTEMGSYRKCIHGGEKRFVEVKNRSNCTNIQAVDSLDAFVWTCDVSSGTVRMITGGLRAGKHLSHLIDWTTLSFRPIQVTVTFTDNGKSTTTNASTWWNNPIVANPAAGTLAAAGTVYIFTANPAGAFDLNADRIAFVGRPGANLSGSAAPGEQLVRGLAQYFLWVEGDFDLADDAGIQYNNVYFSVLRNVRIQQSGGGLSNAIVLNGGSSNNLLSHITVSGESILRGIENGNGNRYNTFYRINVVGPNYGFYFGDAASAQCNNNVLLNYLIMANASVSVIYWDSDGNVALNGGALWSNGTYAGFVIGFGSPLHNLVSNLYSINHLRSGLTLSTTGGGNSGPSHRNQVSDVALLHHPSGLGFGFANPDPVSSDSYITGELITGANANNCEGVAGSGILTGCNLDLASDFIHIPGQNALSSFVERISTDDTSNPSDTSGTITALPADRIHFDHWLRIVGRDNGDVAAVTNIGPCTAAPCRIWDFRLRTTDTVLRSRWSMPSGNDVFYHLWNETTQVNCEAIPGAVWQDQVCSNPGYFNSASCTASGGAWSTGLCSTTFLRRAYERINDGIGNENGLCESNETCIFTPNIGPYQGHGNLIGAGPFTDGVISNVRMLRYETNGI
ncbi:MAG TPA: hypothetical protein DEA96_16210 [Leptospiraceae bacterium]|nr:hypothetical protein [Leptospiraceae bacterium]